MIAELRPYPVYKESGLRWLGQVPGHWEMRPTFGAFVQNHERNHGMKEKTVLSLSYGRIVIKPAEKLHGLVPESFETYQIVNPGNIVLRTTDLQNDHTSLRVGMVQDRGIITSAYLALRASAGVSPAFGFQFLNVWDTSKAIYGYGSGLRQNLDFSHFKRMPVAVPPPAEQAAIVRFLDWACGRLERAIRAKRRVITLLSEQKQAIIHRAVTRGLDPSVPLKPSGIPWLGEIPQHWEVRRLKSVLAGPLTNGVFKRGDAFGSGVPLVNVADIYAPEGRIRKERLERVRATPSEVETFRVLAGDLFFVRSSLKLEGTGRCAFAESLDPDTVFECHVVRARPDQRRIETRFLALFLSSWAGVNNTVSRANTVTMSTLAQGAINSLPIVVPPLLEQRSILGLVDAESKPLTTAISDLEREIELLREYRIRLVADVVTGKLDVRETAAQLPAVAAPDTVKDDAELSYDTEPAGEDAAI